MNNGLDVGIRTQANEHPGLDTIFKSWEHDHDQAGGRKGSKEKRKGKTVLRSTARQQQQPGEMPLTLVEGGQGR